MTVKTFRSSDYGAPVLYGAVGYIIPLLDACLVNGYGQITISTMTHSGGIVTVTTAVAHGLKSYSRQTIAGANEAGYNGDQLIMVTGTYTFTFASGTVVASPATGTLTTKSVAAGWIKPYTGANLAVFKQGSGNQRCLRVDDTTTISSRVVGYEDVSAISTGNGPFPTAAQVSGGLYFEKSSTADATNARDWILIADERTFYLWVNYNSSVTYVDSPLVSFGDYVSTKSGDTFNTYLMANTGTTVADFRFSYLCGQVQTTVTGGMYSPRSYTQVGTSVALGRISDYARGNGQANMGLVGMVYPHQTDGALHMAPVWINESATVVANQCVRGTMVGTWCPLHNRPLANGDIFLGSGDLAGKVFLALAIQPSAMTMIEVSSTWSY